jgi:hypothetical protein
MKQYLELFNESINTMEEVCYHVALNSRIIAQAAGGERGDVFTLDLCIKFFNTYLRSGMNQKSVHCMYIVMAQYRSLAEVCINYGVHLKEGANSNEKLARALEDRVVQICKYMRYLFDSVLRTHGVYRVWR